MSKIIKEDGKGNTAMSEIEENAMSKYVVLLMSREEWEDHQEFFKSIEDYEKRIDYYTGNNPDDLLQYHESLWHELKQVTLKDLEEVKEYLEEEGYKVLEK